MSDVLCQCCQSSTACATEDMHAVHLTQTSCKCVCRSTSGFVHMYAFCVLSCCCMYFIPQHLMHEVASWPSITYCSQFVSFGHCLFHSQRHSEINSSSSFCLTATQPLTGVCRQAQYVLDARHMGNAARFINHSCDPNLYVLPVLSLHHDHTQPSICLFAGQDITPGTELT